MFPVQGSPIFAARYEVWNNSFDLTQTDWYMKAQQLGGKLAMNHTESFIMDMRFSKSISKVDLYPRNDSGNIGSGKKRQSLIRRLSL